MDSSGAAHPSALSADHQGDMGQPRPPGSRCRRSLVSRKILFFVSYVSAPFS